MTRTTLLVSLLCAFLSTHLCVHGQTTTQPPTTKPSGPTGTTAPPTPKAPPTCKKDGCGCKMSDGTGTIDLSPLSYSKRPYFTDVPDANSQSNALYYFNPCHPFTLGDENSHCTVEEDGAVCQNMSNAWANLGKISTATYTNMPGQGIIVTYSGGTNTASSSVLLVCSEKGNTTSFIAAKGTIESFHFVLTSEYCCPQHISAAVSIGTIMVAAFFSLLVVYLIIGIVYLAAVKGGRGTGALPNARLWASLPGLIKDGILFTFTCGKKTPSGGSTYENL
ncbi:uncharacterized protein [Oscarella lobularis]|uniref:uncharacterized protein n=1 Tax=Oscarella lobularis TaxID=121494 RepID=UPI003313EA01